MQALVEDLRRRTDKVRLGGGEDSRKRHVARGKLLPRARVRALLDRAHPSSNCRRWPRSTCTTTSAGLGRDHRHRPRQRRRMRDRVQRRHREGRHLLSDDGEEASPRQEVANGERLPCIYLVDSGGANLPQWPDVFPTRIHFGRIFYNQANMSAHGHPAGRGVCVWARARQAAPTCGDERRDGDRAQAGHHFLAGRPGEGRDRAKW